MEIKRIDKTNMDAEVSEERQEPQASGTRGMLDIPDTVEKIEQVEIANLVVDFTFGAGSGLVVGAVALAGAIIGTEAADGQPASDRPDGSKESSRDPSKAKLP